MFVGPNISHRDDHSLVRSAPADGAGADGFADPGHGLCYFGLQAVGGLHLFVLTIRPDQQHGRGAGACVFCHFADRCVQYCVPVEGPAQCSAKLVCRREASLLLRPQLLIHGGRNEGNHVVHGAGRLQGLEPLHHVDAGSVNHTHDSHFQSVE